MLSPLTNSRWDRARPWAYVFRRRHTIHSAFRVTIPPSSSVDTGAVGVICGGCPPMPSVSTERFKARGTAQVSRRPSISTPCGSSLLALRADRLDHRRNVLGYAMRRLTVLGLGLTAAWVLVIVIVLVFNADDISTMTLNAWGDFLAGVSAPLALLWLVIGYFQHGEELRLNTRALEAQQEELRRQVEETATLAKNAERQARAAEGLERLRRSSGFRAVLRHAARGTRRPDRTD